MANLATWTVKRLATGNSYHTTPDGSFVTYRCNAPTEAGLYFTPEEAKNVFTEEDAIELYIDIGSGATKVFRGFIDDKGMRIQPGDVREVYIHAVDWGFYLAGKRIFEKQYWKSTTAGQVFKDAAARVTDGTTTLSDTAVDSLSTVVKREFFATQVKDAWHQAGLDGGADYFVDTTQSTPRLNAFAHDSKSLQTGGTNYKIVDYKPTQSYEIMRDPNFEWNYFRNVAQRFRSVVATNGIAETFPNGDLNEHMGRLFHDDINGRDFHFWFSGFGNPIQYDPATTSVLPVQVFAGDSALDAGGAKFTIAKFNIASTSSNALNRMVPGDNAGNTSVLNIAVGDYQELRLFIRNQLSPSPATIEIRLNASGLSTDYFVRQIQNDLNSSNWTFLRYDLPTASSNNGWSVVGTRPTTINNIDFRFFRTGSTLNGYTSNTSVSFAWVHLFRRQRAIVTGSGTPATEKILVDKSLKNLTNLQNLASSEQARVNVVSPRAYCVCDSNLAFIKPGYKIDIDFDQTLESNASGTLRMAEIKHFLWHGYSKMALTFNRPYSRV